MGGFGALLGGVGLGAGQLGSQLRQQEWGHHENELTRWNERQRQLMEQAAKFGQQYRDSHGTDFDMLSMKIGAMQPEPGKPLPNHGPLIARMEKLFQEARATRAAQKQRELLSQATRPTGAAAVQPVVQTPGQQLQAAQQAALVGSMTPAPTAGPAAQSPVNPVQGGAGVVPATFPELDYRRPFGTDAAFSAGAGAAPESIGSPMVGNAEGVPPVPASVSGHAAYPAGGPPPLLDMQEFLGPSLEEMYATGKIDPIVAAMIPSIASGQASLALAGQRAPIIEHILDQLKAPQPGQMPDFNSYMRAGAELANYGIQGGMGNMVGPMLGMMTPQNVTGTMSVGDLEAMSPGIMKRFGFVADDFHPNHPVRIARSKYPPYDIVAIYPQDVRNTYQTTTGGIIPVNPYTNEQGGSVGTPVGMAPTQTTQDKIVPGQLPETTTTTQFKMAPGMSRTGAAASPAQNFQPAASGPPPVTPPAGVGGGAGSGTSNNSLIGRKYQDWVSGGPAPTGKELTAVQEYARQNNLQTPIQYSPAGQKALSAIDPIMAEVDRAIENIDKYPGFDKLTKIDLAKAKAKYDVGLDDPLSALIADLGYADIRSAAQALQGTGSRAERILNKALEHTPNISILRFDEPSLIKKKLREMKIRLKEARDAVLEDEKKSGVLSGAPPVPAGVSSTGAPRDPAGIR